MSNLVPSDSWMIPKEKKPEVITKHYQFGVVVKENGVINMLELGPEHYHFMYALIQQIVDQSNGELKVRKVPLE